MKFTKAGTTTSGVNIEDDKTSSCYEHQKDKKNKVQHVGSLQENSLFYLYMLTHRRSITVNVQKVLEETKGHNFARLQCCMQFQNKSQSV